MFLETDRIILREINRDDNDELYMLESDPEIMRFVSNGVPLSREQVEAGTERILNLRTKHSGRFGCWAAVDKATGKFLGWFLFRPAHNDAENLRRIEIGYRLKKKYWGLGIATEVVKAIIEKGFNEYSLLEIFAVAV
ncbi:MAG: N-acetyltransferase, partial [Sphingobacteriales bacterium]